MLSSTAALIKSAKAFCKPLKKHPLAYTINLSSPRFIQLPQFERAPLPFLLDIVTQMRQNDRVRANVEERLAIGCSQPKRDLNDDKVSQDDEVFLSLLDYASLDLSVRLQSYWYQWVDIEVQMSNLQYNLDGLEYLESDMEVSDCLSRAKFEIYRKVSGDL